MRRPLTIELLDQAHAATLRTHLDSFDVDTIAVDGGWELRINLVERNPESRIVNALDAIDSWLLTAELESIRVKLDGSSYTLHTPPPKRPAALGVLPRDGYS